MENKLAEPLQPPNPEQPPPKPAWYSKLNWLGVFTIIIGISEYLKLNLDVLQSHDWNAIINVVVGLLIVILRYFTTAPIATVQQIKNGEHKK